ncbi:MAG: hypothetical protein Q8R02_19315 [Hyphomonadaceae bacterium]|nr:hypothetical protein [Hyphomonadaceae bacterium]
MSRDRERKISTRHDGGIDSLNEAQHSLAQLDPAPHNRMSDSQSDREAELAREFRKPTCGRTDEIALY